jgi:uridine kinase
MVVANQRCWIMGIAGGSGSGKTEFARQLHQMWGPQNSVILLQDNYYIDQSARFDHDGGRVNFDHPDSLDFDLLGQHLADLRKGKGIDVPLYDFATHTRLRETQRLEPHPVVMLDGILILSQAQVLAQLDFKVFIWTQEEVRFMRRLARDVRERGRTLQGVKEQFEAHVKPMHDKYVEPSARQADKVFSGETDFAPSIKELQEFMATKGFPLK